MFSSTLATLVPKKGSFGGGKQSLFGGFLKLGVPLNHPFTKIIFRYKTNQLLGTPNLWKPPFHDLPKAFLLLLLFHRQAPGMILMKMMKPGPAEA
jgi:hypothetical protein